MANRLSNAQIAALLAKTVSNLKPGELEDLRQALDSRNDAVGKEPDHVRNDHILNEILPTSTTTSTTTTTTSTTTTTTTSTTTHTTTTT